MCCKFINYITYYTFNFYTYGSIDFIFRRGENFLKRSIDLHRNSAKRIIQILTFTRSGSDCAYRDISLQFQIFPKLFTTGV